MLVSVCIIGSEERTIDSAAFVDFNLGRGFSAFGAGGGRAAVWGEAASFDSEVVEEMTIGGESGSCGEGACGVELDAGACE